MAATFTRRLAGATILIGYSVVHALTPLTPQLTAESRQELLTRLTDIGFPEVGQNSVLIALIGALGMEAQENAYSYDTPYPHLPKINAQSIPNAPGCASVTLVARYAPPSEPLTIRLRGTYCLVGPAKWQARQQLLS